MNETRVYKIKNNRIVPQFRKDGMKMHCDQNAKVITVYSVTCYNVTW